MTILIHIQIFMTSPWSPTMSYLVLYNCTVPPLPGVLQQSAPETDVVRPGNVVMVTWDQCTYTKCDASEKNGNWKFSLSKCLYVLILKALTTSWQQLYSENIILATQPSNFSTQSTSINLYRPHSKFPSAFCTFTFPAPKKRGNFPGLCLKALLLCSLLSHFACFPGLLLTPGKWRELESWFP